MNWIDKIFKDQLGSRKFPDELRNNGKVDLEFLLAKEMPVAAAKAGKGGLFYGGLSVLIVALIAIPAGIWYNQQQDEVNQQEYSINFGQASGQAITALPENKAGTSGSWNVANNTTEPSQMECGEVAAVAGDKKASVGIGEENALQLANDKRVAEGSSKRNSNRTAANSNDVNATVASNKYSKERKPVLQTTTGTSDKVGAIQEPNKSKTIAYNQIDNATTDEGVKDASEPSTNSQPSVATSIVNNSKVKIEDADIVLVDQNEQEEPDAIETLDIRKEDESENTEEIAVATQAQKEEAVNPVESKKQSRKEAEDNSTVVDEETLAQGEEKEGLLIKSTSNLQLNNLAFSDMGTDAVTDLSQYKSLSPKRMAISLWVGYTYVGKTINGGAPDYLNIRKEKEDAIWTLPTGLTFDYYLTNKWTLSIGAGFSEYGEVLNYDYEYERKGYEDGRYGSPNNYNGVTRLDSVRVITGINKGHWEYYFDYTETDTVIKNNNGQTRWSYVEIPILVGYRFGSGKLKPWVQLGASVGIPYNQTFRYISPSGDGLQTNEESSMGASDLQFNGLLNVGFDYYLSRHFSLRLNAVGSYQLNPAFKFDGIKQNYYRMGGTLGVAYNF